MPKKIITTSEIQTKKIAKDLAASIKTPTVICLYGNLGGGKTTFTQGLAEYFGIKRVISPTFVIMRQYHINLKFKIYNFKLKQLYHIDLYRLENIEEIKAIGMEEILNDESAVVIIEWAEKLKELLPKDRIDIYFKYISENEREITIRPGS